MTKIRRTLAWTICYLLIGLAFLAVWLLVLYDGEKYDAYALRRGLVVVSCLLATFICFQGRMQKYNRQKSDVADTFSTIGSVCLVISFICAGIFLFMRDYPDTFFGIQILYSLQGLAVILALFCNFLIWCRFLANKEVITLVNGELLDPGRIFAMHPWLWRKVLEIKSEHTYLQDFLDGDDKELRPGISDLRITFRLNMQQLRDIWSIEFDWDEFVTSVKRHIAVKIWTAANGGGDWTYVFDQITNSQELTVNDIEMTWLVVP